MRQANAGFAKLLSVLDRMAVLYVVGGSVASSAHGVPRTTLDLDMSVDLREEQIDEFAASLQDEFYADADLIREMFRAGRAANLIHMASGWKFDLFPMRRDAYAREEVGRRVWRAVSPDGSEPVECAVLTAEDIVLRKLEWFKAGRGSSERQWSDIRGVLRAAGVALNVGYLRTWAPHLGVEDLLERALREVERSN